MASFRELTKKKSERQVLLILVSVCLALLGIVVACFPRVQVFLLRILTGGMGLVYLLAAGVLLTIWFLILGFRGKALRYALLILIFTILCIWLAINLDLVWNAMVNTFGLWPTILIVLLGTIGVWFVIKVLL